MTTIPDDEVDEGTLDDVDLTDTAPAGPYAATAWRYLRAGWAPLPLPPARKDPPPHGCTGGRAERYPSGPDVQAWIDGPLTWRDVEHGVTREFVGGAGNVGLRMPADVIGLDVDCYDGKPGAATIAAHEERFGLLPLTWMSGSRTDGSGIRFYRVPEGLRWRDLRGGGVEMIRAGHRYAVAWPSLHPGGATYRWTDPDGRVCDGVIPSVHDLAHLPEAWVIGLTGGETAVEQPRAGLTWDAARAWVASGRAADPRCWRVAAATSRAEADLALSSSRHDAALRGVQELAHLHNEGHAGVAAALASLRDAFARAVGSDRDVTEEWARMCAGAVDIAAATVAGHRARCDCDNPLAGLMPAPLQLPKGLTPWTSPASSSTTPTGTSSSSTAVTWPSNSAATGASRLAAPPAGQPSPPSSSTPSSTNGSGSAESAPSSSSRTTPDAPPSTPTSSTPESWSGGSTTPSGPGSTPTGNGPAPASPAAATSASAQPTGSSDAPPAGPSGPTDPEAERAAFIAQAVAAYTEQEYVRERARRDARARVEGEDIAAAWSPPLGAASLTEELEIPDEPVTYRVDRLLPSGGNAILTAQFKAGKTSTVNHLVKCLADGHRFLGEFSTVIPERRIAVWNYEVGRDQYRRWLRDVDVADTARVVPLTLRGKRVPLRTKHVEDWAVRWLVEHDVEVWVIDPLARAIIGSADSENDAVQLGAFFDTIDVIKERAGVAECIIPVHTGRGEGERARGSTRIDDWPDVAWTLIKNDEGERFFRAYGRDVEVPEGRIVYDPLTRSMQYREGEDRKSEGNGKMCADVLRVVNEQPGAHLTAIAAALGVNPTGRQGQAIREAVHVLAGQSMVRTVTEGRAVRVWPFSTSNHGGRA